MDIDNIYLFEPENSCNREKTSPPPSLYSSDLGEVVRFFHIFPFFQVLNNPLT